MTAPGVVDLMCNSGNNYSKYSILRIVFNLFQFSPLYFGSFAFVIIGVIVFNLKPTPSHPSSSIVQSSLSYRQLEQDSQQRDVNSSLSSLPDHVTSVCCQELRNVSE